MLQSLSGATRIVPIVGDPIAQVQSPVGVTAAFASRGIGAICIPLHVAPADFAAFMVALRAIRNIDGLIVTMPHKRAAFGLCDTTSERARFLGAVNTIRRSEGSALHGDMFDGLGFVSAAQENGCEFRARHALLVGAGGAGTAIAHAVADAGVSEIAICDVDEVRARDVAANLARFGFPAKPRAGGDPAGFDLVINATPLGMRAGDPLPLLAAALTRDMFVADVVTKPEVTPLLAAARARGCRTSTGVDMFNKVAVHMVDFLAKAIRQA